MFRQRWFIVGLIVIAAAISFVIWRPWISIPAGRTSTDGSAGQPAIINDAKMVNLVCAKSAGGPCKVTLVGGHGDAHGNMTANLQSGEDQSMMMISGPYTIESVTVERSGKTRQNDLKITIPGGETREIRVNEDDSVTVTSPK